MPQSGRRIHVLFCHMQVSTSLTQRSARVVVELQSIDLTIGLLAIERSDCMLTKLTTKEANGKHWMVKVSNVKNDFQ